MSTIKLKHSYVLRNSTHTIQSFQLSQTPVHTAQKIYKQTHRTSSECRLRTLITFFPIATPKIVAVDMGDAKYTPVPNTYVNTGTTKPPPPIPAALARAVKMITRRVDTAVCHGSAVKMPSENTNSLLLPYAVDILIFKN